MKSSELLRILKRHGWYVVRQKGSHLIMRKEGRSEQLTVPSHGSNEVGKGLQHSIMKRAKIDRK